MRLESSSQRPGTATRRPLFPSFLAFFLLGLSTVGPAWTEPSELPWKAAGLDERQAAAHLLDRLAYGPRPGDIDRVVEMGLETWVDQQIRGSLPDPEVDRRLSRLRSLELGLEEMAETYVEKGMAVRMAERDGVLDRSDLEEIRTAFEEGDGERPMASRGEIRGKVLDYARERGLRSSRELMGELMTQKLVRALHSNNQLTEMMTDFWFNHFNVSLTDNQSRIYLLAYERDAIRPHVLGEFRSMLEATARHPAMLHYLDNTRSVADEGAPTRMDSAFASRRGGRRGSFRRDRSRRLPEDLAARRPTGLNENYARELLELHTLGVDGGYTQDDVVEVARAFTGWTAYPNGPAREEVERRLERVKRFPQAGFVVEEGFIFRADVHDAGAKTVLGHRLSPGRGIEDGVEVLEILAVHPSTARHLAHKLAVRFVSDEPPAALVDRLAKTFEASGGDSAAVMRVLVASPEFWSDEARQSKIKSPFELVVSALRALDARLTEPRELIEWVSRLGQPLYAYQAPTGYPDRADAWVNTGSLLGRMNFGLELASEQIYGARFDLQALGGEGEPESLRHALEIFVPVLLPERSTDETIRRLLPVALDPELATKVADRAEGEPHSSPSRAPDVLAQVVGVILGSPEFQRR